MTDKVVLFETELNELKKLGSVKEQTTNIVPGINTAAGQEAERARQAARFADFRQRNPNLSTAAELAVGAAVPGTAVAKGGAKLFNWLKGGDAAKKAAGAARRTEPRIDLPNAPKPKVEKPPGETPVQAATPPAPSAVPAPPGTGKPGNIEITVPSRTSGSPGGAVGTDITGAASGSARPPTIAQSLEKQIGPPTATSSAPAAPKTAPSTSDKMSNAKAIAAGLGIGAGALGAAYLASDDQKNKPASNAPAPNAPAPNAAQSSYTVKAGDTLGHIAQQYNTTVSDLIKNKPDLVDTETGKLKPIMPGQTINIGQPVGQNVNVWKGYDFEKLGTGSGKEFKESVQELKKLSGMVK